MNDKRGQLIKGRSETMMLARHHRTPPNQVGQAPRGPDGRPVWPRSLIAVYSDLCGVGCPHPTQSSSRRAAPGCPTAHSVPHPERRTGERRVGVLVFRPAAIETTAGYPKIVCGGNTNTTPSGVEGRAESRGDESNHVLPAPPQPRTPAQKHEITKQTHFLIV